MSRNMIGRLTFTPETGQTVFEAMVEHPGAPVVDLGDVRTFPEVAMIVWKLAERGPFIHEGLICFTCLKAKPEYAAVRWFRDPANHEPTCLWRRSRALYPGEAT